MRQASAGYTLAEALTAMAVVAVSVAIGLPAFAETLQRQRTRTAMHQLGADFALARSSAISRRVEVVVCADDGRGRCAGGQDWSGGWLVFLDPDGDRQPTTGTDLLRTGTAPPGHRLLASRPLLRFRPDGRAAGTNLSVHVCRGAPEAAGSVVVNNLGRVRSHRDGAAACGN